MCTGILEVVYYPILLKLKDVSQMSYRTFTQAKQLFVNWKQNDLVLLYIMIREWQADDISDLNMVLLDIQQRPLNNIPHEDIKRIVSSFSNINANLVNDFYNVIPNLTYQDAKFILYGLNERMFMEDGIMETWYLKKNIIKECDFPHFAGESDINQLYDVPYGEDVEKNVVNVVELTNNRMCFAIEAICAFNKDIIVEAFTHAVVCSDMKPKKFVSGWPFAINESKVHVFPYTREDIDALSEAYDANLKEGAVSRREGIAFKNQKCHNPVDSKFTKGIEESNNKEQVYRKKPIEIISNLDNWIATKQHLLCGRPYIEPVRNEEWLRKQYTGLVGNINYPNDVLEHEKKKIRAWNNNSITVLKKK